MTPFEREHERGEACAAFDGEARFVVPAAALTLLAALALLALPFAVWHDRLAPVANPDAQHTGARPEAWLLPATATPAPPPPPPPTRPRGRLHPAEVAASVGFLVNVGSAAAVLGALAFAGSRRFTAGWSRSTRRDVAVARLEVDTGPGSFAAGLGRGGHASFGRE